MTYNSSQTKDYQKYYTLTRQDIETIQYKCFIPVVESITGPGAIDILFLGAGTGRLEIPLLEILSQKPINVTAVDASQEMLDIFSEALTQKKLSNVNLIEINCCDIGDFDFSKQYDIITAFFILHMLPQWVDVLKSIITTLKPNGFFLTAEETGTTKIIDRMIPHENICDYSAINKNYHMFWNLFHAERINLGKIWFQPLIASDHSLIAGILKQLGFFLTTENIAFDGSTPFSMDDFNSWLDDEYLFTPIGRYLTQNERKVISSIIKNNKQISFGPEPIKRQEGHNFLTFQKQTAASSTHMSEAIIGAIETFIAKTSNIFFIDPNIQIDLDGKNVLFNQLVPPLFESAGYLSAIKNRLFSLSITMLSCFHKKVHFDYVIWKPDYYSPEKSTYKHGLPSFIHLGTGNDSKDIFNYYLATYSLYFYVRNKITTTKTFVDLFFKVFRYFDKIILKRGKKINVKIDLKLDKTIILTLTFPSIEPQGDNAIEELSKELADSVDSNSVFGSEDYLFNFDDIIGLIQNNSISCDAAIEYSKELLEDYAKNYYDDFKNIFSCEIVKLAHLFNIPAAEENEIKELFKSLFCFNLIGIGRDETRWEKIRFYLGFIFGTDAKHEGFNILTNIDFSTDDITDAVVDIPSKIWSSKDGLYSSLQLVKEYVYKHALQSAISAIMARNMSHNIGSHVIFYSTIATNSYTIEDYQQFQTYLQERMDFLSLVSTTEARWGLKYGLEGLVEHFEAQKILLDNIVKSEGIDNDKVKIKIKIESKLPKDEKPDIKIPHGEAGKHAIYAILENFIRNTAKHQWSKLDESARPHQFEVNLVCEEIPDFPLLYKITLSSNVPGCHSKLIDDLNKNLSDKIIDERAELLQTYRGLKEQRISSCFLRLLSVTALEEFTPANEPALTAKSIKPLVKAVCIDGSGGILSATDTCDDKDCSLGLEFYVLKPAELLWIGKHNLGATEKLILKNKGVLVYDTLEAAEEEHSKTFPGKMVLLSSEYTVWLHDNDNLNKMPFRILIIDSSGALNPNWVPVEFASLPKLINGDIDTFVEELLACVWKKWVKGFFRNYVVGIMHKKYKSKLLEPYIYHDCNAILNDEDCKTAFVLKHGRTDDRHGIIIPYGSNDSLGKLIKKSIKLNYLRWEIAEMVYVKILIVDERINDSKNIQKNKETVERIWARQGVDIVDDLIIVSDPFALITEIETDNYTFLIIHQGIIDKIKQQHANMEFDFDAWWKMIEYNVSFTIIDSGRGEPDMIKEGKGRWLQLSDLAYNIIENAQKTDAKYNLIQVLNSLREGKSKNGK